MLYSEEYLINIKFGLECIGIEDNTFLFRTDGITCDDIEDFCVCDTPTSRYIYVAKDIPQKNVCEIRRESWYHIPSVTRPHPDCVKLGTTDETFETFVVYDGDVVVSKAWSIRITDRAAEVAVETLGSHRGRGYGRQVVSAWAAYQLSRYKIPIYAHRVGNELSSKLAASVSAVKFADVVSYHV